MIFDFIIEGPEERFDLASNVAERVRSKVVPEPVWYCNKYKTLLAAKLGRSKCMARVNRKNHEHSAARNGCGPKYLIGT